ncbi:hypothetical protein KSP40_PGU008879 [Platanthera guangdongensis]|uniref:Uncharacterized protein n=1 Tax=Platanthera guangdongensis TaxID=2320717 RepID=A0ABR2LT08_9ASPA
MSKSLIKEISNTPETLELGLQWPEEARQDWICNYKEVDLKKQQGRSPVFDTIERIAHFLKAAMVANSPDTGRPGFIKMSLQEVMINENPFPAKITTTKQLDLVGQGKHVCNWQEYIDVQRKLAMSFGGGLPSVP